jgi:hypothetical protein
MKNKEIFSSAVRSSGDQAGVFEFDGETGYFYLYEITGSQGQKVICAIRVVVGMPDFDESDVAVRWDANEDIVGFFVRRRLWAAFDARTGEGFGGDYRPSGSAVVPAAIREKLET